MKPQFDQIGAAIGGGAGFDAGDGIQIEDNGAIGSGAPNAPGPGGYMATQTGAATPYQGVARGIGGPVGSGDPQAVLNSGGPVGSGDPQQAFNLGGGQAYLPPGYVGGLPPDAQPGSGWGNPAGVDQRGQDLAAMFQPQTETPGTATGTPGDPWSNVANGISGLTAGGSNAPTTPAQASATPSGGPGAAAMPTPEQLAGFAPRPFQDFGNIPFITPATYDPAQAQAAGYSAQQYGPAQYGAAQYDPTYFQAARQGAAGVDLAQMPGALKSFESMNRQALQPQFDAQRMSLDDNLGSRGIVNSGASTYLNNQLGGQQDAALASMDAPMVQAMAGYWNQGQESNAGFRQQALTANADRATQAAGANAGAANAAGATNAAARQAASSEDARLRQEAAGANAGAVNAANATSAGFQQQTSLDNAQLRQQAAGANAGAQNQASSTNAAAYGSVVGSNEQAYNNYQQWLADQAGQYGQGLLSAYLGGYGTANPAALATLGQSPGQVGAAYQTGYGASGGPGLGGAFSSLVNAFSRPSSQPSNSWYSDPNVQNTFANGGPTSGNPAYD